MIILSKKHDYLSLGITYVEASQTNTKIRYCDQDNKNNYLEHKNNQKNLSKNRRFQRILISYSILNRYVLLFVDIVIRCVTNGKRIFVRRLFYSVLFQRSLSTFLR